MKRFFKKKMNKNWNQNENEYNNLKGPTANTYIFRLRLELSQNQMHTISILLLL